MNLIEIVQKFAANNGCAAGVCDAAPLDSAHLSASEFVPFVSKNIDKRTSPAAIMAGAQSVIVLAVPYLRRINPEKQNNDGFAVLSSLGTNDDYHIRVKLLLSKLADELTLVSSFNYKILVDSPTLDERAFALRAGIGFFGRNGLIISPMFGSRFNIGLLLTDIPIECASLSAHITGCPPNCRLCIDACPNKALAPGHPLDTVRCISYLTQKGVLTADEEAMLNNQLYGCDICQNVCPFNSPESETYVNPQDWANKDNCTFVKEYAHTAMLWQGAALLRRNAALLVP